MMMGRTNPSWYQSAINLSPMYKILSLSHSLDILYKQLIEIIFYFPFSAVIVSRKNYYLCVWMYLCVTKGALDLNTKKEENNQPLTQSMGFKAVKLLRNAMMSTR